MGIRSLALGYQVLIAIVGGILVGVFFGPLTLVLKPIGDIFTMLLQMVILPYIAFSLIHGLGSISPFIAKKLLKRSGVFLIVFWALAFLMIFLLTLMIPPPILTEINTTTAENNFTVDFLSYVIPENPFYDLANNIVPAIAIFSLIVGAAVMHIRIKEPLLSFLERTNSTIEQILLWLAKIAPIGIFADIAYVSGNVSVSQLFKLEFYIISFVFVTLFITFFILPILFTNMTSIKYREVLREFKEVALLAFATGMPSIAFPFINRRVRILAKEHQLNKEDVHTSSQTIVPLGYSFAQIGNCFILYSTLFISFYFRQTFTFDEKVLLSLLMVPLSFGASPVSLSSMQFILKQFNFPQNAFEFYKETLDITTNFEVMLSICSVFTFVTLALLAYYGHLKIQWRKLLFQLSLATIVLGAICVGVRIMVTHKDHYKDLYLNLTMNSEIVQYPSSVKVEGNGEKLTTFSGAPPEPVEPLERVLKNNLLRVGYDVRNIPFCYTNSQNQVVGFDIAYAYQLAHDLDTKLVLEPLDYDLLGKQLDYDYYDIAMSAVLMDEKRIVDIDFTNTYEEQPNVLVIPKSKISTFKNLKKAQETEGLTIGYVGEYVEIVKRHFPLAKAVSIDNYGPLLQGKVDAVVWSRVNSFIWCLGHTDYVVMYYGDQIGKKYFAYAIRKGAYPFLNFLNNWLYLKQEEGFEKVQKNYWVEGILPESKKPRWSIIRDVLHWVD